jgi:hypothetical protein
MCSSAEGFAMKPLFAVSVAVALSGLAGAAPPQPGAAGQATSMTGVVKAIRGRVVVLDGDRAFSTGGHTQYLLETGRDPQVVTRAVLKPGVEIEASTKDEGGEAVADMVFIRRHSIVPKGVRVAAWLVTGTVKEVADGRIVIEDIVDHSDQEILVTRDTRYFTDEKGKGATDLAAVTKGTWVVADLRGQRREETVAINVVVVPPGRAR